jgi:uncharacterized membrane protein
MAHRYREVSRIEGFSDAVFGFAITLLVVSLEVPRTFDELLHAMRAFPAFAVSFLLLFQIWRRHYKFFRSYGLEDGTVVGLTGALLFVVLFYVYPLKFVWSLALAQLQGVSDGERIHREQWPLLMEIYGGGVIAIFGLLALFYAHAYRLRAELQLSPIEILEARVHVMRNAAIALWGVLSVTICVIGGAAWMTVAGLIYFGIGLSEWGLGEYNGRMKKKMLSTAGTSPA